MINQLQPIFDETGLHPSGHWFDPSSAHHNVTIARYVKNYRS